MNGNKIIKTLALTLAVSSVVAMTPNQFTTKVKADEWVKSNGNWYLMDTQGKSKIGWISDNGNWYYFWSNGVMAANEWIQSGSKWYYLDGSGALLTNAIVDGYNLGSDGAWVISKGNPLEWKHSQAKHVFRIDIACAPEDEKAGSALTNCNLELTEKEKYSLHTLAYNIANESLYVEEAKAQCIGKTIENKAITDIKFTKQVFKNSQGIAAEDKIKTIKASSIYNSKSTAPYVYDAFLVFSGINSKNNQWECMRVIIELGDI